jgi:hypothetical protein
MLVPLQKVIYVFWYNIIKACAFWYDQKYVLASVVGIRNLPVPQGLLAIFKFVDNSLLFGNVTL